MRAILVASLVAVTLAGAAASCGDDDTGGGGEGPSASASSSTAETTGTSSATGTGGEGGMFLQPACDAPAVAPSKGSCVTVIGGGGAGGGGGSSGSGTPMTIECNPVTGEPCDVAAGDACDVGGDGNDITGFKCYPAPNTIPLCGDCTTKTDFCKVGTTCDNATHCFAYCCDDGDCGTGSCHKGGFAPVAPDLGICVE